MLKHRTFLIALGLLGAACSHNGNSNSTPATPPPAIAPLGSSAVGSFTANGPAQDKIATRYLNGCEANMDIVFDARVAPGQITQSQISFKDHNGVDLTIQAQSTVLSVAPTQMTYALNIQNASGTSMVSTGENLTETCTLSHHDNGNGLQDSESSCTTSPAISYVATEVCDMTNSTSPSHVETPGTYRLFSGKVVQAYKIEEHSTGDVRCGPATATSDQRKSIGSGTQTSVRIVSNQIVTGPTSSCGGAEVLSVLKIDANGTSVSVNRNEVLDAALAP